MLKKKSTIVKIATGLFLSTSVWADSLLPSQPPAIAQTPNTPGTANGPGTSATPGIMSSPGESLPQPFLNTTASSPPSTTARDNIFNPLCSNMKYNIAGNDSQSLDLGSSYQCQSGIGLEAPSNPIREKFGAPSKPTNQQAGQAVKNPDRSKIVVEPIENNPDDNGRTH